MRHTVHRTLPLLVLAGIGWLVWSTRGQATRSPAALLPQPKADVAAKPGTAVRKGKSAPKPGKPLRSKAAETGFEPVRAAGTSQMKDPPRHWDEVDEENDESFPASDPPGRY